MQAKGIIILFALHIACSFSCLLPGAAFARRQRFSLLWRFWVVSAVAGVFFCIPFQDKTLAFCSLTPRFLVFLPACLMLACPGLGVLISSRVFFSAFLWGTARIFSCFVIGAALVRAGGPLSFQPRCQFAKGMRRLWVILSRACSCTRGRHPSSRYRHFVLFSLKNFRLLSSCFAVSHMFFGLCLCGLCVSVVVAVFSSCFGFYHARSLCIPCVSGFRYAAPFPGNPFRFPLASLMFIILANSGLGEGARTHLP